MVENLQFALEFQCIYIQIIHFLQEKKIASNFVLESMLFFFKRYRRMAKPNLCNLIIQNYVNQKGNDLSYFGNSSCPRNQPHRYKYSYLLLHQYNLPRFRGMLENLQFALEVQSIYPKSFRVRKENNFQLRFRVT